MEILNHALEGIPQDRIRYHVCWGSWPGPHTTDVPLRKIVDLILKVNAGAYLLEAANPRHEHEWRLWEDVKLPRGKAIIPGVISHCTVLVEHLKILLSFHLALYHLRLFKLVPAAVRAAAWFPLPSRLSTRVTSSSRRLAKYALRW